MLGWEFHGHDIWSKLDHLRDAHDGFGAGCKSTVK